MTSKKFLLHYKVQSHPKYAVVIVLTGFENFELQKNGRAYTKEVGSFKSMSNIKLYV